MRRTCYAIAGLLVMTSFWLGCGTSSTEYKSTDSMPASEAIAAARGGEETSKIAGERSSAATRQPADGLGGEAAVSPAEGLNRKIIYSAKIDLAVESFSDVPDKVVALVKQHEAYVADSNLMGASGENRRATWKIRVPVARFEEFVNGAKGLGELINASTSSRDVSEEYYDVDARIRNKTKEEERLLKLLEDRPGKLEDVVAIERELSRVREELERMQGRLRVLTDLSAMTTVDLTISEIRNYMPPEAPTLSTRTRRTFSESLGALQHTAEALLLVIVAAGPWLIVAAPLAVVGYAGMRSWARKNRRTPQTN